MKREFNFRVRGIELSSAKLLDNAIGRGSAPAGYVSTIANYGGELDRENLKKALDSLIPKFPLILSCYGWGKFEKDSSSPGLPDEPRTYRHNCTFSYVCCDNTLRGESDRRRGVFLMVSDVLDLLCGVRFELPDPDDPDGDPILLNPEPFTPTAVELIARFPQVTAYAIHFGTYVPITTLDRTVPSVPIEQIVFGIDPLNGPSGRGGLPGVHFIKELSP